MPNDSSATFFFSMKYALTSLGRIMQIVRYRSKFQLFNIFFENVFDSFTFLTVETVFQLSPLISISWFKNVWEHSTWFGKILWLDEQITESFLLSRMCQYSQTIGSDYA